MAVKDEAFAQVGGTVGRVFTFKGGTGVVIETLREGSQYPDRVTAWGVQADVHEGDRLTVKGWLSWKPTTYEKRDGSTGHGVEVSLNKPTVVEHEPASTGGGDVWATSVPGSDGQVWH